jgi:hypothetical protein
MWWKEIVRVSASALTVCRLSPLKKMMSAAMLQQLAVRAERESDAMLRATSSVTCLPALSASVARACGSRRDSRTPFLAAARDRGGYG